MDIEKYEAPARAGALVPKSAVDAALNDAAQPAPSFVHPSVARIAARGARKSAWNRLDALARAVMATDPGTTDPAAVWAADWTRLEVPALEALDRGIQSAWSSPSTRNAARDAIRTVIRTAAAAGDITYEQERQRLAAVVPEKRMVDEEKQARGHIPDADIAAAFTRLASDPSPVARRDAAVIAIMAGCGLRRGELVSLDIGAVDDECETLSVVGKGGKPRTVPLPPGTRRAVKAWLEVRGREAGPLVCQVPNRLPRNPVPGKRVTTQTVANIVRKRVGDDVQAHDLRRTFIGNLLDSGADLSTVAKLAGHGNPETTSRYDRRGPAVRRAAVERLHIPFR